VSRYQKGKTNVDFTEARDSEWQWYQLRLAPDKQPHQHPTTHFLQAGCLSCRPANSVKALKAHTSLIKIGCNYMQTAKLLSIFLMIIGKMLSLDARF